MMWIKLGILLTGFLYAGVLPYSLRKSLPDINIDLSRDTLSFLSNKELYGKKFQLRYTWLLFMVAILLYIFFVLLMEFYNLGRNELLIRYLNYSFGGLTILAFLPHNMKPFKRGNLGPNLKRALHNVFAVLVFLMLPTLTIYFQIVLIPVAPILGIIGLVIIGLTVMLTAAAIIKNGLNGLSELIFINGISIWGLFITTMTMIR